MVREVGGKAWTPPAKWTAATFAEQGARMITILARVSRLVQRQQGAAITRTAFKLFKDQIRAITERAVERIRIRRQLGIRSAKASELVLAPGDAQEWISVAREFAAEQQIVFVVELAPQIQSTMAQGYSRTAITLGLDPVDTQFNAGLAARARGVAAQIVDIDERTRDRVEVLLGRYIEEGIHPSEVPARLTADMDAFNKARSLTIGRTESNRAWTQGSVQALKELGTCTAVDVIGCESRELERWDQPSYQQFMYQGESTCNIEGVPMHDADKLNFHPNHTGTIVPSAFLEI
jgi:hypothetical protein